MLFCSQQFLMFFLVVFSVSWGLPRQQWGVYLLCGVSFCFYASWNKWLAVIIFVSTIMDYCVALSTPPSEWEFKRSRAAISIFRSRPRTSAGALP